MASKNLTPPRSLGRQLNFTTGRANALCQKWLEPHGLSLSQWVVLSCLWRAGDLSIGELAELTGNGVPATSRIVDRMADRGLVRRARDPQDKRSIRIVSTEKGDGLTHLATFYEQVNDALLDGFSQEERLLAFALLARMERNAETALADSSD